MSQALKNLTVEDARARMLDGAARLGVEAVALSEAVGRVLARDVVADRHQPPFDASAMDGWAVRSGDVAPGAVLDIMGESAAGHALDARIGPGQTARISTGAALPPGAVAGIWTREVKDARHGRLQAALARRRP